MRLIFLDIDGPMIPSSMFFIDEMASWDRVFSPISIAILNALVEKTGAKIVTNSSHNSLLTGNNDLNVDLINAGVPANSFHKNWRTEYPSYPRDASLKKWLVDNDCRDADWICFDDVQFTDDDRLILVDFDTGLTTVHYNLAMKKFGLEGVLILG